jgi:hypothetical protein
MIAKQHNKENPSTDEELGQIANLSTGTVVNVIHDLVMFGAAKRDSSETFLGEQVEDSNPENVLRRLRQTLGNHAVTLKLKKMEKGSIVSTNEMIEILKEINPAAQHRERTWKIYADRISHWLTATGYLVQHDIGWVFDDRGDINPDFTKISVGYYNKEHFFIGDSSPAYALQALEWLIKNPKPVTSWSEFHANKLRNAAQSIRNLGIIVKYNGEYIITEKYKEYQSALEILWVAASKDKTLQKAKKFLKDNPLSSGRDLGKYLNDDFERNWSDSSIDRIGNSLRQWAHWLILGETSKGIPDPLGARYKKTGEEEQPKLL